MKLEDYVNCQMMEGRREGVEARARTLRRSRKAFLSLKKLSVFIVCLPELLYLKFPSALLREDMSE